jgi:Bacterial Ig-like domain (group 3)
VAQAASAITLYPATPVAQGQAVTFTAVVAAAPPGAATPTGTVTFYDGTPSLGTGKLSVVNGQAPATFTTSGLAVGPERGGPRRRTVVVGYSDYMPKSEPVTVRPSPELDRWVSAEAKADPTP